MGKKRGNNKKRRGSKPKQSIDQDGFWHKSWRKVVLFWGLPSVIFGVIGWYTSIFGIVPDVKIEPSAPLNPEQPFSAPIKLTNETLYSLTDVKLSCQIANATNRTGNVFSNIYGSHDSGNVGTLKRKETHQVACPLFWLDQNTSYLDIDVILDFKGYWGSRPMQIKKRLLAVKDSEGKFQWLEKAESSRRSNILDRPAQLQP
jgi:hypothetical protein